jgi:glycosyltransferase involved in cell wall biosynthesis
VPEGPAVLHLISSLEVGGAERLLIDFVKSCAEAPQVPQVVVVMNDRVDRLMVTELNSTSTPTYYLGRPQGSRNPRYIVDLMKIIQTHHVSVIHSHDRGSKYWSELCRVVRSDLKLAHTLHDTRIKLTVPDMLIHNSMIDVTIAISPAVFREACALKIRRVEEIENGIPISLFLAVSPQPLDSMTRIISVGRLFPEKKGQDVLIRALRRCVDRGLDVECTFVGSPATADLQTLPRLEALISNLQLSGRVHFVQGRIDISTLLADADMFVLPSRWEGFGLALVEAMAAGLPVIASNIDGPASIVTDGLDGLLFESGSDEQLAEKIEMLIQSPTLACEMAKNGRTKSVQYDIATMRDKYMTVYRRLILARE